MNTFNSDANLNHLFYRNEEDSLSYNTISTKKWGNIRQLQGIHDDSYCDNKITIYSHQKIRIQPSDNYNLHWLVVKGMCKILSSEQEYTYVSNDYIKILPNVLSCVENNEDSDTEIIEIRIGKNINKNYIWDECKL